MFVCTGNICRSPTAERLAVAYAARFELPQFRFSSAGTRAMVGHPIHPEAARVLEAQGGDPSGFAARQLTQRNASEADLVLAMTKAHRDVVLELAPRQLHRTFTLTEAATLASAHGARAVADLASLRSAVASNNLQDIADPIGSDSEFFTAVGAQIAGLLPPILRLFRDVALPSDD